MHGVMIHLSLICLLAGSTPTAYADREAAEVLEFVTGLGQKTVDSGKTVGLCIGVARGDTILCAEGFGLANVELNVPVTRETVFRIGSISKQFTAAAVMLLVEQGQLELDAPISMYLPDYPEPGNAVTVRQLLLHTSGVKDFTRLPEYQKG